MQTADSEYRQSPNEGSLSKPGIRAQTMVNSSGSKGRPAYWARSAKNDPPVVFPNLHPLASWQDGRKYTETIPTVTENEARIQKNPVEAAQAGKENVQGLYNSGTSTDRPVPPSTRDVHTRDTVASRDKRKLDTTSPEPLPSAKRIHGTEKDGREEESELGTADKYTYMKRRRMREECWSRSIRASGGPQDLRKRLRLYDAAQEQISSSQASVKQNPTSYTSSRAEPLDRYTHMSQKDLRKQCAKRSLRVSLAKRHLRRCLRLYDAARALGLTPEESLEAQRATFEHSIDEDARSVSPRGSIGRNTFGPACEEAVEGRALGSTSQKSIVDNGQGPTSLKSSEDDASPITKSETSSENNIASSSATSHDSTQDRGTSYVLPGPTATTNYATMSQTELRSMCRSRSLRQNGLSRPKLRMALTAYDRKSAAQTNNAEVKVGAEHKSAELGIAPSASPPPAAFIDLDSSSQDGLGVVSSASHPPAVFIDLDLSSQDGETLEQGTRLVAASAAIVRKESESGYLWTVNKGQRPPVSTDAQVDARQGGSKKRVNAWMASEKDPYMSPYSPRLVLKPPKRIGNESSPWATPYTKHPISLQQPLVSLLNLTTKDIKISASESAQEGTQMKTKSLSEYAIKMAEKEEFNARYTTESPTWICCCETPGYEVRQKQLAAFSGNCFYHVPSLAQRGTFTIKEYQEYVTTQQALSQIESCLCQKPAVDHPEHQVIMTQGGFILGQIWREQLTRRQSLTRFRPDMAAYRRKGILEVMHNVQEDFMIELSSRQQKRPLVLWARMEAMAWLINTLPTSNEWRYFQDWTRPCHYIMLFGVALLTTIDALLQKSLFKDKEPKIPNLGLVLALFIQSTFHSKDAYNPPFNNDICVKNENGWAAEVVSLADQHGVRIDGAKSIDFIVDQWRLRKKSFESIRDRARKEQYATLHNGETIPSSEATLASMAAKEGETPAKRGTGPRVTVRAFRTTI